MIRGRDIDKKLNLSLESNILILLFYSVHTFKNYRQLRASYI